MRTVRFIPNLTVWLGIALVTAWSWWTAPLPLRPDWARAGVTVHSARMDRTSGGQPLWLDIYLPAGAPGGAAQGGLRPAMLAIHGGSWSGGSRSAYRSDDPRNTVLRLVQRGMVVIAVDYSLATPGAPSWPAAIDDVREAVRWARRHAGEIQLDPGRIAVMGQSSGAHLAALLGTLPDEKGSDGVSSRVQAVVSFYGPFDLAQLAAGRRLPHEPIKTFLGATPGDGASLLASASPLHHVSTGAAPMLLLHGTDDAWVPLEQAKLMSAALAAAKVHHRLVVVEGARHGFEAGIDETRDFLPEIFAFLESVWNVSIEAPRNDLLLK